MDIVFEALYFVAIGLLAIIITVFVLAVSLLGRAVKLSLEDQEKAENNRKADTERTRAELKGKLDQATYDRESLEKSLKEYKKKVEKHDRTLRWIRWKPNFLKANWGVFVPGLFFIIVIGISAFARYQLGQLNTDFQYLYFGLSLFALSVGIVFICLTLKVIEGVAITSEETASVRQKEIYKAAMIELEELKRPYLDIQFRGIKFPLKLKINTECELQAIVRLLKGEIAENIETHIGLPIEFKFIEEEQYTYPDFPRMQFIKFEEPDLKKGLQYERKFKIKTPDKVGVYKLICFMYCKGSWPQIPLTYDVEIF